jgi:hypothetical protein
VKLSGGHIGGMSSRIFISFISASRVGVHFEAIRAFLGLQASIANRFGRWPIGGDFSPSGAPFAGGIVLEEQRAWPNGGWRRPPARWGGGNRENSACVNRARCGGGHGRDDRAPTVRGHRVARGDFAASPRRRASQPPTSACRGSAGRRRRRG